VFCGRCGEPLSTPPEPATEVPEDQAKTAEDADLPWELRDPDVDEPQETHTRAERPNRMTPKSLRGPRSPAVSAILVGSSIIAASIVVGALLLAVLLQRPEVESAAYQEGYRAGYDSGQYDERNVEAVCSEEDLTVGDQQPTPREAKDWVAGCKGGYEDGSG
jgi:hypothetical protein